MEKQSMKFAERADYKLFVINCPKDPLLEDLADRLRSEGYSTVSEIGPDLSVIPDADDLRTALACKDNIDAELGTSSISDTLLSVDKYFVDKISEQQFPDCFVSNYNNLASSLALAFKVAQVYAPLKLDCDSIAAPTADIRHIIEGLELMRARRIFFANLPGPEEFDDVGYEIPPELAQVVMYLIDGVGLYSGPQDSSGAAVAQTREVFPMALSITQVAGNLVINPEQKQLMERLESTLEAVYDIVSSDAITFSS